MLLLTIHPQDSQPGFALHSLIGYTVEARMGIGETWDTTKKSLPTGPEERAEQMQMMRRGLPEVRHKVFVRYERMGTVWHVVFTGGREVLRKCRFRHDSTLLDLIRRGRGMGCLEDCQSVERGVSAGNGGATLHLDADQLAALSNPR